MAQQNGSLKRNLGLWAIVGLGLGYMTPTVVFDTFAIVSEDTHGAVPSAYVIALVVMAFTAISYGKMVRAIPSAGSAYTYTRESMHPNVGFMVGWVALLDYIMLPLVNVLILRQYMEQLVPAVNPWLWVFLFSGIVTASVYFTMKGTSNLNSLLLVGALIIMASFLVMLIGQVQKGAGTGQLWTVQPFIGQDFDFVKVVAAATVVCFSFIGFDAVTMYAEEAKNPKIMPKAILLTVLLGGLIFLVASYFTQQRFPDNSTFGDVENALPQMGQQVGGDVFMWIFTAAGFAATMASALASHASVARMLLVMGRNGVLPRKFFGYVSPKTNTPIYTVLLVGVVTLLAGWLDLEFTAHLINFGALIAFTFVNLSVIAYYAVRQGRRKTRKDIMKYIVMPIIGTGMTLILWVNLESVSLMLGSIWLAIGLIYLVFLTKGFRTQPAGFDEAQPVTGFTKAQTETAEK
ncbi:APC family permease [Canibacter zhoujuaniae]|uniref:APC family permease n=1 Tax=Canibacter zhoujuaniae TaxID=2708343 RepID=UPI002444BD91|nr:APC family permease [Canibacter zhoujuaniae]